MGTTSSRNVKLSVSGKISIVTGCNTGIGRETALELARGGAVVIMACRNADKAQEAASYIREACPGADVEPMLLDLKSNASVRNFVTAFKQKHRALHVLVNNAGAPLGKPWYTEEGVGGCAQVNFLGPYVLTRLLEQELVAGAPSRVVNVSSIMSRMSTMKSVSKFLRVFEEGLYGPSKLANVVFTHELHRRWAGKGIEASAVDPGAVASDIWRRSLFSKRPLKWFVNAAFAPPWDGAKAVLHAAGGSRNGESEVNPDLGLFFAKGVFAFSLVTASPPSMLPLLAPLIALDWPLRNAFGHRWLADVREVKSCSQSQDKELGRLLWNEAADLAGLPRR